MVSNSLIASLLFHIANLAFTCVMKEPILVPAIFIAIGLSARVTENEDIGFPGRR
jgi:hypothetical protein